MIELLTDFDEEVLIDVETKSGYKLKKSGTYKYVEHPDFDVLMLTWIARSTGVSTQYDLTKQDLPRSFIKNILLNPRVLKRSHNAAFERISLGRKYNHGVPLPAEQWRCSMVQGARAGYPLSLDASLRATKSGVEKMTEGSNCIKYFSEPCKPTKVNGGRTWNLPEHDPVKYATYLKYNAHDVVGEAANLKVTRRYPVSDFEHQLWQLDQKINDVGVKLDKKLVRNALAIHARYVEKLKKEGTEITGLQNVNSTAQLRDWIIDQGEYIQDLKKATVAELLADLKRGDVKRVLEIRQEMAKTSVKKYTAMLNVCGRDGRLRGLTQFYGANRTGRWAGRLVQLQNLPQNKLKVDKKKGIDDLGLARRLVKEGNGKLLEQLFGNVPDVLSQLIRTALVPEKGSRLIISDFSAIEARVIAWLFNEEWRLKVFATHGMIYEASASKMFKVPLESIRYKDEAGEWAEGANYALRAKGKVAELALGYQGSIGAMINMGALKMGLEEKELLPIVKAWRKENPNIVQGWYRLQDSVIWAIQNPKRGVTTYRGIKIFMDGKDLRIQLPSGRLLSYVGAHLIHDNSGRGRFKIRYWGINDKNKWAVLETYGGKITENIVQAIARDCLAVAMMRLDYVGYKIVFHVHDETVLEMPKGKGSIEHVNKIMAKPMKWAPDLPLGSAGFETYYYKKD